MYMYICIYIYILHAILLLCDKIRHYIDLYIACICVIVGVVTYVFMYIVSRESIIDFPGSQNRFPGNCFFFLEVVPGNSNFNLARVFF